MIEDGSVETKSPRPYLREGAQLAGRYTIIREIGRGGYSAVYAARDEVVRSLVAIKLLVPPPAIADITRERMRREVQVVRQLTHPHIVPVHDFVDDGERSFIVMRLIDGETVADAVKRHGPLPVDTVLRIVRGIASALASAHRIGVLHRDVKPQNILLDQEGTPLLADFGSAHVATATTLTRTGTIIGTVGYLAPNVAAGGRADARDDLYALGMTAVFALTGQLPGRGPRGSVIDRATGTGVRCGAERPDLPPWFEEVIASLTAPDPRDRVPTCDRLLAVLDREQYAPRVAYDEERCLVCGEPDALGHAVCDVCAHVESDVADTLLIIRGEDHALARVPAAVADAAVERLRSRGRDAVALPATRAWTVIPRGTMVLAMLVIASGAAAVRAGVAESYVTPVIIATGLLFLAERGLRQHRPPRRSLGSLPVGLNRGIAVQTLSGVGAGQHARWCRR
ncbi:MAG: serine/threonine-protein kinase [Gemmatimonadaceae bacterium]